MNVASLELCKELYELSGWANNTKQLDNIWGTDAEGRSAVITGQAYGNSENKIGIPIELVPAYDLSYLLRKLPDTVAKGVFWRQGRWNAEYLEQKKVKIHWQHADNPEDAIAKLLIELFKQGVINAKA